MVLLLLVSSLFATNMKVAILDFAKKDSDSDYVAKAMMKRDFKTIFKSEKEMALIDLSKSQALAKKSGYTNLFYADIADIANMGTELGADVVVWGEVQSAKNNEFKVTAKILSMKSNEVVQVTFNVEKSSKKRQVAIKDNLIAKISEFSSGEVEKLFGIAMQYFNSKNYPEALKAFTNLIVVDPENIDSYFYLGLIKYYQKDYEASVAYYQKGLEINPEHVDFLNFMSKSYDKMGDVEAAAEALEEILSIKEDKEIWLRIGNLYAKVEYFDEATEAYQNAIELDEEYGEAYRQLGILQYNQEFYEAAIEPLEKATKLFPDADDLQKKLAKCYKKTGKINEAIAQYKSIIAEQKDNVRAYMNLINAYFTTDQYKKALEMAIKLNEIAPEDHNAKILLANAYNYSKMYSKAAEAAKAALSIDDNLYQPYRILSEINFSLGYERYEKYLELEEKAKDVYGEEADRLVQERDSQKEKANNYLSKADEYLKKAKARTKSSSELRYIKARKATIDQLLKATEKGFF
jgi:tetratricopeptide (TPR) repeat protein